MGDCMRQLSCYDTSDVVQGNLTDVLGISECQPVRKLLPRVVSVSQAILQVLRCF